MIDDETFLVLNAAHLRKMATADHVVQTTELPAETVQAILSKAAEQGWLLDMEGQHLLVPEGTQVVQDYYKAAFENQRADPALAAWYERFEALNDQFIKHVSDWQKSEGDERAQTRLTRAVERLVKSLAELTPTIPRYRGYATRFERGLSLIDEGKLPYVCSPTVDSVHNVWFEFHEDILSVLGRPRDT